MDITQIFIIISLTIISLAIAFSTYYLIGLIKELSTATSKITQILDDTHKITQSVSRPVSSFSDFLMGFQNGFKIFNNFFDKKEK
ncbi:MAG: hypothetical protein WAV41_05935 [Microgenomates group bacterium]